MKEACFVVLLVIVLIFYTGCLKAQSYDQLFSEVDSLRKLEMYDAAASVCQTINSTAHLGEDWQYYYKSVYRLFRISISKGTGQSFLDSLDVYSSVIPDSLIQYQSKIAFFKATTYSSLGKTTQAIESYEQALPLFKILNDTTYVASTLKNLTNSYLWLGDNQSALKMAKAGALYLEAKPNSRFVFDFLISEGIAHFYNTDYSDAIKVYKAASLISKDHRSVNLRLAQCYNELDSFQLALDYLNKVDPEFNPKLWYTTRSEYYQKVGNLFKAIEDSDVVVELTKNAWGKRDYVKALCQHTSLLEESKDLKKAMRYAHNAMCVYYHDLDSLDIKARPPIEENVPEVWMIEAAFIKAKYFIDEMTQGIPDAESEVDFYFEYMFQMYDVLRTNQLTLDAKYQIGTYSQTMYDVALSFYVGQYQEKKESRYFEKALHIAQLSNAFVLRKTIEERKAFEYAGVPDSLIDQYLKLKNQLGKAQNLDNTSVFDSLIYPFNVLTADIKDRFPKFRTYANTSLLTISEVQKSLTGNMLIIKYKFLYDKLFAFVINQNSFKLLELPLENNDYNVMKNFGEKPGQYFENLNNEEEFIKTSHHIYQLLLSPILNDNLFNAQKNLVIIPDGPIKKISYSSLLSNDTESWSNVNSYLINNYSINYLYYLSQLTYEVTTRNYQNTFVGFGIQYSDEILNEITSEYLENYRDSLIGNTERKSQLSVLNNTDDEVRRCSEIWDGNYFVNDSVNLAVVKNQLENSRIAHFAGHAILDQGNFKNSFIALHNKNKLSRLGYDEILSLQRSPELVVLSACQTSIGQQIKGEGAMSLARIFTNSGSKAAVGSYWNVPDKPASIFMELFYNNLKKKMSTTEAIRMAQIEYLSNDELTLPSMRAPYYWAGWTLYGNDSVVETKENNKAYLIILFCFSLLFIVISGKYLMNHKAKL